MEKIIRKLVRDNIPEIIEEKGNKAIFSILNEENYYQALKRKLVEEAHEFADSDDPEELADLCEVAFAIIAFNKWRLIEILKMRADKAKINGKFDKRIFLEEIDY